jgi:hypothetical protein
MLTIAVVGCDRLYDGWHDGLRAALAANSAY